MPDRPAENVLAMWILRSRLGRMRVEHAHLLIPPTLFLSREG
jgi:hypothetical protein